jgi:hypothetical protein
VNHTPLAVGVVVGVVVVVVGAVVVVVGVVVAVIGVVVVVVGVVVVVVGVVVVVVGAEGIVDGTPVSAAPMVSLSARGAKALEATEYCHLTGIVAKVPDKVVPAPIAADPVDGTNVIGS